MMYRAWEFTTTTEGWNATNLNSFWARNGFLTGTANYRIVSVSNRFMDVRLLRGNKNVTVRMAVSIPQTYEPTPTYHPTPTPTITQTTGPFVLKVSYMSSGVQRELAPVQGKINGGMIEYILPFTDIAEIPINSLKLEISSIKPSARIQFDYIRLSGTVIPTPTMTPIPTASVPTPTPRCTTVCYNGGNCIQVCNSTATINPTRIPTLTALTPIPTAAVPTSGCVTSCKEGQNCIMVCNNATQ